MRKLLFVVVLLSACGPNDASEEPQSNPDNPTQTTGEVQADRLAFREGSATWAFVGESVDLATRAQTRAGSAVPHEAAIVVEDTSVVALVGGEYQAVGRGTTRAVATWDDLRAEIEVAVYSPEPAELAILGDEVAVTVGFSEQIGVRVTTENGEVVRPQVNWVADDPSIASLRVDGASVHIEGKAVGSTNVRAVVGELEDSLTVTVRAALPANLAVAGGPTVHLEEGETFALQLVDGMTMEPIDEPVEWSVDDSTVASLTGAELRAMAIGVAEVTGTVRGRTAKLSVEVLPQGGANTIAYPGPCVITESRGGQRVFEEQRSFNAMDQHVESVGTSYITSSPEADRYRLTYDAMGRLVTRTTDRSDDGTVELTQEWDYLAGDLVDRYREVQPSGHYLEWVHTYDELDRVLQITETSTTLGLRSTTTYQYATDGLSAHVQVVADDGTLEAAWNLVWDAAGRLIERHQEEVSYYGEEKFRVFTYDDEDRLVEEWVWAPFSLDPSLKVTLWRWVFLWDRGGNKLRDEVVTQSAGYGPFEDLVTYDYSCWGSP